MDKHGSTRRLPTEKIELGEMRFFIWGKSVPSVVLFMGFPWVFDVIGWVDGKNYRKTPHISWEKPWFPGRSGVKIFPNKPPIHWWWDSHQFSPGTQQHVDRRGPSATRHRALARHSGNLHWEKPAVSGWDRKNYSWSARHLIYFHWKSDKLYLYIFIDFEKRVVNLSV